MKRLNCYILLIIFVCLFMSIKHVAAQEQRPANRPVPTTPQQDILYLTPEQEADVIEYLKEYYPDNADRLSRLKELRPDTYREQLSRVYRQMRFLENLKETDPEQYERVSEERNLESKSNQLASQYKNTTDENEKEKIKTELEDLLYRLFDYRQINRIAEIERLEERLGQLKQDNQNRLDNKDQIVNNRLNEMLGETSGLEW